MWFPVVPRDGSVVPGASLCSSPGVAVQSPAGPKCKVKGGAEIAKSVKIAPLTTHMTKLKRKMTKLNERRSLIGGGALFASVGWFTLPMVDREALRSLKIIREMRNINVIFAKFLQKTAKYFEIPRFYANVVA